MIAANSPQPAQLYLPADRKSHVNRGLAAVVRPLSRAATSLPQGNNREGAPASRGQKNRGQTPSINNIQDRTRTIHHGDAALVLELNLMLKLAFRSAEEQKAPPRTPFGIPAEPCNHFPYVIG